MSIEVYHIASAFNAEPVLLDNNAPSNWNQILRGQFSGCYSASDLEITFIGKGAQIQGAWDP